MVKNVYLDNSATTKPCTSAIDGVLNALENCWGNPSSLHRLGVESEMAVTETREAVAKTLGCRADEVYFTSCGTESNNTALICGARARKKRGNKIVTTALEHPSVLETLKSLEDEGFEIVKIMPDGSGNISREKIFEAIDKNTILVSIMLVNNETGAIFPVDAVRRAVESCGSNALIHCDAVQAFGKMPIDVKKLGVDMLSLSGHKIHGPKGIGALYIKKGVAIKPYITGGGQERGMRSGTESVPLICGLHGAIDELGNIKSQLEKMKTLRDFAVKTLTETGIVTINSPDDALPYILNISLEGYRSETLLHFLESMNIFVSSGSACAKGEGSYVLTSQGLSRGRIDSALRISFSRYSTEDDIIALRDGLIKASTKIRRSNI